MDKQRPYHVKIKNKLNQVVFGFDKKESVGDWKAKIEAQNQKDAQLDLAAQMQY